MLSRGLNNLHTDSQYKGSEINHLSYADDTILFCSGDRKSVIKMMNVLRGYEAVSGQLINKAKSCFFLHEKTPLLYSIRLRTLIGIRQGNFPLTYLGYPVYYGRRKCLFFEALMRKVARRILT